MPYVLIVASAVSLTMTGCAGVPRFSRLNEQRTPDKVPESESVVSDEAESSIRTVSAQETRPSAPSSDLRLTAMDRETRELLQSVLDVSPSSERDRLLVQFASMEPAQARVALQHRLDSLSQSQATEADEPSSPVQALTTGHSFSEGTVRRESAFAPQRFSAGIGTAAPWNRSSPASIDQADTNQERPPVSHRSVDAVHGSYSSGASITHEAATRKTSDSWYGHSGPRGGVASRVQAAEASDPQLIVPSLPGDEGRRQAQDSEQSFTDTSPANNGFGDGHSSTPQFDYDPNTNTPSADTGASQSENPFAEFERDGGTDVAESEAAQTDSGDNQAPRPPETVPPLTAEDSVEPTPESLDANPFEPGIQSAPAPVGDDESGFRRGISRIGRRLGFGSEDSPPVPSAEVEPASDPRSMLRSMIARLESELAAETYGQLTSDQERSDYIRRHVDLRLMYLIGGQSERTIDSIPGIDPAEQEYWQQLLWSLTQYFDHEATPSRPERLSQTVAQLRQAIQRLQEEARLEIRNANFCRKITSFGNYDRFESDEFTAGQPVLLYAEIENYRSQPTTDGRFRTLLKSTVEIHRDTIGGEVVDSIPFSGTEDICSSPRRDYFHSYELLIPQRIRPGAYVLKITIEDQLSGKTATETVNFTVR